jgi:hypothetical protein
MAADPTAGRSADAADALLSAYVDGVAELSPAERRAIEEQLSHREGLRLEAERARAIIGALRELAPPGDPPDWSALERSIASAVREVRPARWRRLGLRWLVPGAALAAAAATAALVLRAPTLPSATTPGPERPHPQRALRPPELTPAAAAEAETVALWLAGEALEVDFGAEALLAVPWERGGESLEDLEPERLGGGDLAWVDDLDGESLERAAAALEIPPTSAPTGTRAPRGDSPAGSGASRGPG